jgi:hypothetical protein
MVSQDFLEKVQAAHTAGRQKGIIQASLEDVFRFAYETGEMGGIPFARFAISEISHYPSKAIAPGLNAVQDDLRKMGTFPQVAVTGLPNPQIEGDFLFMGSTYGGTGFLTITGIETFFADGTQLDRPYFELISPRAFSPHPHIVKSTDLNNGRIPPKFYTTDSDGSNWTIYTKEVK